MIIDDQLRSRRRRRRRHPHSSQQQHSDWIYVRIHLHKEIHKVLDQLSPLCPCKNQKGVYSDIVIASEVED